MIARLIRPAGLIVALAVAGTAVSLTGAAPGAASEPWYLPGQTWSGVGGARGAGEWSIEIVFAADGTARIDYPSIPCGGTLTATALDADRGVFTETITRQPERCADRGTVTLVPLDGKTLAYSYASTTGTVSRGRLSLVEGAPSAQPAPLGLELAPPADPAPLPDLAREPDSDADTVRRVQQELAALGYDPGPADGIVGLRTRRAIRAFQAAHGLPVDGEIGEPLVAALAGRSVVDTTAAPAAPVIGMPTLTGSAAAARLAHACDLLAAHPDDPQAVVDGVYLDEIDAALALDVCREARLATPGLDRVAFQEARVLIKLERYAEARELLSPLAAAEHAPAQHLLGSTYVEGSGPPPADPAQAVEWYEQAAAKGFAPAQAALASARYSGDLRQRTDHRAAVELAEAAAMQGNIHGMALLGHAYETGQGVGVSSGDALRWYRGAAEAGHDWALEQVERFDPAGARQLAARMETDKAARAAAYAERRQEAQEILAAVRPTLQLVATVDGPTAVVERLEDLGWAVADKLRGDVALVARALAQADAGAAAGELDQGSVLRALLDGASLASLVTTTPPAVVWALLNASPVDPHGAALDPEQTALMREVAALDADQAYREAAFALYLAGEGALTSPLVTAGPAATQRALQQRLQRLAAALSLTEGAAPDAGRAALVDERLDLLDQRLAQAGITLGSDAADSSATLAALADAYAAAAAAPPDTPVVFELALAPQADGWIRLAGRLREATGQPLAEVGQQLRPPATLADERLLTATGEAGDVAVDLAFLMLAVLPTELDRFVHLMTATLDDLEQRLDLATPQAPPAAAESVEAEPAATEAAAIEPVAEPGTPLFPAAPEPPSPSEPEPPAPEPPAPEPEAEVVAALPEGEGRTATVRLADGSEIAASLVDGTIVFRSAFGELDIDAADIAALDEEALQLTDGTVLRGSLVSGRLTLATGFGRHALDAQDIRGIVIHDP